MRPFVYERADGATFAAILAATESRPEGDVTGTQFLAGGTTLIDLMKLDVMHPDRVVDINPLADRLGQIAVTDKSVRLGGLVRMSQAADHPTVRRDLPLIAQSLEQAAS